jgi:hypothetical protein
MTFIAKAYRSTTKIDIKRVQRIMLDIKQKTFAKIPFINTQGLWRKCQEITKLGFCHIGFR